MGDVALPTGVGVLLSARLHPGLTGQDVHGAGEAFTVAAGRYGGVTAGPAQGPVAVFSRASDALRAAIEVQLALQPDEHGPRYGLGVHVDEVELREGRPWLDGALERTGHLASAASAGQVLITAGVRELAGPRLPEGSWLRDLGEHRLPDLGDAVHVWQLCHLSLPLDFPALRSLDGRPHNLPGARTPLVGRAAELAELHDLLRTQRLVTVLGPGGAGKTRLAVRAAADRLEALPGGAWFIDLAPLREGDEVPGEVARSLRLDIGSDRVEEVVADHVGTRACLLLLDNCEHLLEPVAALVDRLLGHCASLQVLTTSREQIGVAGETVWRIPPLSLPPAEAPNAVDQVSTSEAVQLFISAAARARPGFQLDETNAADVLALCRRLDGIPLALELAAANLGHLSVDQVLARLDDRFRLLGAGPRTALPRQQTLRASVDWSYQLLSPHQQVLLDRMSVFAGAVPTDAVCAVAGFAPLEADEVPALIDDLVKKSVVTPVAVRGGTRFVLLDTLRHFAAEQLDHRGETTRLRQRHAQHWRRLADALGAATAAGAGEDAQELLRELDETRAETERSLLWGEAEDLEGALVQAAALKDFWGLHPGLALRWLRRLLERPTVVPPRIRADALLAVAHAGEFDVLYWHSCAEEAGRLAMQLGDRALALRADLQRAAALGYLGETDASTALLQQVGDSAGREHAVLLLETRLWLASNTYHLGRMAEGQRILEELLPGLHEHLPAQVPEALASLALTVNNLGDSARARRLLDDGLAVAAAQGNARGEGELLSRCGAWAVSVGDVAEARRACYAGLALGRATAEHAHYHLALSALLEEDLEEAAVQSSRAREVAERHGMVGNYPDIEMVDAEVLRRLGETEAARSVVDQALAWARRTRDERVERRLLLLRARLARQEREPVLADELAQAALALYEDSGILLGLPDLLEELAVLAMDADDPLRGARLYGSAQGIRHRTGHAPGPLVPEHAAERAALLDDASEEVEASFEEGRSLSAPEAVAYARRGRGRRGRPRAGWSALTPTEIEVVRLITQHLSNPQIAERLFMSRNTVKTHLAHVYEKVGITSRSALAAEAMQRGI